jgi:hypothetical protein
VEAVAPDAGRDGEETARPTLAVTMRGRPAEAFDGGLHGEEFRA